MYGAILADNPPYCHCLHYYFSGPLTTVLNIPSP